MQEQYSVAQYVSDLRRITAETKDEDEIFNQVGPLAQRVAADDSWIEDRFLPPTKKPVLALFCCMKKKTTIWPCLQHPGLQEWE